MPFVLFIAFLIGPFIVLIMRAGGLPSYLERHALAGNIELKVGLVLDGLSVLD